MEETTQSIAEPDQATTKDNPITKLDNIKVSAFNNSAEFKTRENDKLFT